MEMRDKTEVWYVKGDDEHFLFATKMDAERYARLVFPDESQDSRYARIYFRIVYTFEERK